MTNDRSLSSLTYESVPAAAGATDVRDVVWLEGEHDLSTIAEMSASIVGARAGDVIVDLSRIEFMGVAAVRMLLEVRKRCERSGGRLVLRSPSPPARRVLDLCGIAWTDGYTDMASCVGALASWVAVPSAASRLGVPNTPCGGARPT